MLPKLNNLKFAGLSLAFLLAGCQSAGGPTENQATEDASGHTPTFQPVSWTEGAEDGLLRITISAPSGYNAFNTSTVDNPPHAFHLTHPQGTDQWVKLPSVTIPAGGAQLQFRSQLQYAALDQYAQVHVSTDAGASWQVIWHQPGNDGAGETSYNTRTVNLNAYEGQNISLRFYYDCNGGGYAQTFDYIGWLLDNISLTSGGVLLLSEGAENGLANIEVGVPLGYDIFNETSVDGPAHAFHLTHPGMADQSIRFRSTFVPRAGAQLNFRSMLRYATTEQLAQVRISTDAGNSWQIIWELAGNDTAGEQDYSSQTVSLAAFQDQEIRIDFYYDSTGSAYPHTTDNVGWFLDTIQLANVDEKL